MRKSLIGLLALVVAGAMTHAAGPALIADAAMRGDLAAVRAALQQGPASDVVNAAQGDGMTALHWAAEHGDADLAALLLKSGANPSAVTRIGRHTPLHVAARGGYDRVVGLLVNANADVNALTTTGATPLHFAAASGSRDAVAMLIDRGASVSAREPQWGQTPLMFAAASGRTDAVDVLLARGADVGATARVVDISARNQQDSVESRQRNARVAARRSEASATRYSVVVRIGCRITE